MGEHSFESSGRPDNNGLQTTIPRDSTVREYWEWYQRVSPTIDADHKGYLTFDDIYSKSSQLRGKDEAMAAVVQNHRDAFMPDPSKMTEEDARTLSYRMPPLDLLDLKTEANVAAKAATVVDWIKDNKTKLHPNQDGLVSRDTIKDALNSTEFSDPESQRMLKFLEAEFSNLATIKGQGKQLSIGVPTTGPELSDFIKHTTSASAFTDGSFEQFLKTGSDAGILIGSSVGKMIGHPYTGLIAGGIAGAVLGAGVGVVYTSVRKARSYPSVLKDLEAAVPNS